MFRYRNKRPLCRVVAHVTLVAVSLTHTGCFTAAGAVIGGLTDPNHWSWQTTNVQTSPPDRGENVHVKWRAEDDRDGEVDGFYVGLAQGYLGLWLPTDATCATANDGATLPTTLPAATNCLLPLAKVRAVRVERPAPRTGVGIGVGVGLAIDITLIGAVLWFLMHFLPSSGSGAMG